MDNEIKNYLEIKKCLILLRYSEYDVTNVTESSQARLPYIADEAAIIHIPSVAHRSVSTKHLNGPVKVCLLAQKVY